MSIVLIRAQDHKTTAGDQSQISSICLPEIATGKSYDKCGNFILMASIHFFQILSVNTIYILCNWIVSEIVFLNV
jgi:hypothetical protein